MPNGSRATVTFSHTQTKKSFRYVFEVVDSMLCTLLCCFASRRRFISVVVNASKMLRH